jgi:heme-degrading monooxygenase HmoA
MIIEHATLTVSPDKLEAFEAAMLSSHSLFGRAEGFVSFSLLRSVEHEATYVLSLEWENLEDHTMKFAESGLLGEFRTLVGGLLAGAPNVGHFEVLGGYAR